MVVLDVKLSSIHYVSDLAIIGWQLEKGGMEHLLLRWENIHVIQTSILSKIYFVVRNGSMFFSTTHVSNFILRYSSKIFHTQNICLHVVD
jgi:hypothetical protein